MIFITPPIVPLPYSTVPPPGTISILSTSSIGIISTGILVGVVSIMFSATPSTITFTVVVDLADELLLEPCPRISTLLPFRLTPGAFSSASLISRYPRSSISLAVITVTFLTSSFSALSKPVVVMTVASSLVELSSAAYKFMLAISESAIAPLLDLVIIVTLLG